jgi:hypothetical protein
MPFAAAPQTAARAELSPDARGCPVVGKTYTAAYPPGKMSTKLYEASTTAGLTRDIGPITLTFTNWPENKSRASLSLYDFSCGPSSNKSVHATIENRLSSGSSHCQGGVCTITDSGYIRYTAPAALPGGKPFKYDLVGWTLVKGKPGIPSLKITITP